MTDYVYCLNHSPITPRQQKAQIKRAWRGGRTGKPALIGRSFKASVRVEHTDKYEALKHLASYHAEKGYMVVTWTGRTYGDAELFCVKIVKRLVE